MRRVIVIGLDGFDPNIVESLMGAGELPHLGRLREMGGYARLGTTYPAQTPVAWSTFATGVNPGGHGIFDFLRRDPRTYLPEQTFVRYEQKNPFVPAKAINQRRGVPLWEELERMGVPSTILRLPCTFPPQTIYGRMLSGMGVPDLRGGFGTSTFYSSAADETAGEGERVERVRAESGGAIRMALLGPRNPKSGAETRVEVTLHPEPDGKSFMLLSEGEPKQLLLREGVWSDWLKVRFKTGLLQSARGMMRFHLIRSAPVFELYASPVNFDPEAPLFPIASPPDYARELTTQVGTFYTTGMVEDHGGLNNGRFDEAAYLSHCAEVIEERGRMMRYELEREEEGWFFCLFDTPDRVQHMFWRDGRGTIADHYRLCDQIIGRVMPFVDDRTLLIVLSDHGMNSFERGINLNTWLYEQGLLALRPGVSPGEEAGDLLQSVDWSRTRAYALGLSGIYLNLRGREEQGIVDAAEAVRLQSAIIGGLAGLGDAARDQAAVRSVMTREQLYSGPYAAESPDLLVNYAGGYRVSWATSLGGIPAGVFEDNVRKWSGDHLIDPLLVPGVLLMNRPFREAGAGLIDLAPTILTAFGGARNEWRKTMEGESLL
ncbi:MAG: alkaline phosphatase family protein [Blastocatellia bacterium]|nr:alkaline phosphatase family protein [Blastocatellia bacterium]